MAPDPRVSVVVLTHQRADELMHCLARLRALPERPPLIVVDNASTDDTAERVAAEFPDVVLLRLARNLGAAGRNAGVAQVRTRHVAFCDDDTWWAPGALGRAADLLDAHPRVGAIAARVLVGPEESLDPTCVQMAASPLEADGLPGPALIGYMAGAVVMRVEAYREAGGYEPRFFLGAEEALIGLDLATLGWQMVYADDVVTHHHPSLNREVRRRRVLHTRNLLWIAWLRLPWRAAWAETRRLLGPGAAPFARGSALHAALAGLPWVLARRRVLSPQVLRMYLAVKNHVLADGSAP